MGILLYSLLHEWAFLPRFKTSMNSVLYVPAMLGIITAASQELSFNNVSVSV